MSVCTVTFKWRNSPTERVAHSQSRSELSFTEQDKHLVADASSAPSPGFSRKLKSISYDHPVVMPSISVSHFISDQGGGGTSI